MDSILTYASLLLAMLGMMAGGGMLIGAIVQTTCLFQRLENIGIGKIIGLYVLAFTLILGFSVWWARIG